jgi:hypothetical protein
MRQGRRLAWWGLLTCVIGCGAALRAIALHAPADADAAAFSYFAYEMTEGKALYRDLAEQKPPLVFWINLVPALLSDGPPGHAIESHVETAFLVVFGFAYHHLCRRWLGPLGALLALLFATIYVNHPALLEGGNLPETYGLTFQAIGFLLALSRPASTAALAGSGFFVLLAVMTKQAFGLSLVLVPIALLHSARRAAVPSTARWLRPAAFAAGALLGLVVVVLPALVQGTLHDWWRFVVHVPAFEYLGSQHERGFTLLGRLRLFATRLSIPATLMLLGLLVPRRDPRPAAPGPPLHAFAAGWFVADLGGAVSSPFGYPHYFLQVVPSTSLWAAVTVSRLCARLRAWLRGGRVLRAVATAGAVLALTAAALPRAAEVDHLARFGGPYLQLMTGRATNDLETLIRRVVNEAGERAPHDVVVWGNRPRIYRWTRTRCPDRYPGRSYLFSPSLAPEMIRMTEDWLDRHRPRFFVVSNSSIPFLLPPASGDGAADVARIPEAARASYERLRDRIAREFVLVVDAPTVGATIYARPELAPRLAERARRASSP